MVDMMTTNQQLFCELLDRSILELSDIDVTFRDSGIEAAEKQLADYIRSTLKTENFFKIPYQPRENAWALPEDDDFAAAEKIINGELRSIAFPHKFTDTSHVDWEFNPTPNEAPEWTWQLSRHHEWRCLGHCYRLSGDEKYAKAFTEARVLTSRSRSSTGLWYTGESSVIRQRYAPPFSTSATRSI